MKLRQFILLAAIAAATVTAAGRTAADMFMRAPSPAMFLVDSLTCLDMLDYFHSGSERASSSIIGGKARVTADEPLMLKALIGESTEYAIALLPAGADTLVTVIETLESLIPDSRLSFYSADWSPVEKPERIFTEPNLDQWLTAEGKSKRDKAEELLPFMLWKADYSPAEQTLTLTNTIDRYFADEDKARIEPLLKKKLTYLWNGKKFILQKQQ